MLVQIRNIASSEWDAEFDPRQLIDTDFAQSRNPARRRNLE